MSDPDCRPTPYRERLTGLAVAVTAALSLLALEVRMRPFAGDGLHLQPWTSEEMMQAVSAEELRAAPLRSLWYLHIQPPVYDAIRSALTIGAGERRGLELVELVDRRLYLAWAALFGLLVGIVFRWLAELTCRTYALVAAALFLLHPATLYYATLLETTLLSALLFTLLFWRITKARGVAPVAPGELAALFAILFLTRSLVQWPWLPLVAAALWTVGYPRRKAARFLVLAALVVVPFTIKQQALFGSPNTSSFAWMNLCRSVRGCDVGDPWAEIVQHVPEPREAALPAVLRRQRKLDESGTANLNHWTLLDERDRWRRAYFARLAEMSPGELVHNYAVNLHVYLLPSSRYTEHALVDRLPYRRLYDTIFSGKLLLVLVGLAGLHWTVRTRGRDGRLAVGLLLPIGALVAISIFGERVENMRFKYFLEPTMYVFLAHELYRAAQRVRRLGGVRLSPGSGPPPGPSATV